MAVVKTLIPLVLLSCRPLLDSVEPVSVEAPEPDMIPVTVLEGPSKPVLQLASWRLDALKGVEEPCEENSLPVLPALEPDSLLECPEDIVPVTLLNVPLVALLPCCPLVEPVDVVNEIFNAELLAVVESLGPLRLPLCWFSVFPVNELLGPVSKLPLPLLGRLLNPIPLLLCWPLVDPAYEVPVKMLPEVLAAKLLKLGTPADEPLEEPEKISVPVTLVREALLIVLRELLPKGWSEEKTPVNVPLLKLTEVLSSGALLAEPGDKVPLPE